MTINTVKPCIVSKNHYGIKIILQNEPDLHKEYMAF